MSEDTDEFDLGWGSFEVKRIRPDLTDTQANQVTEKILSKHSYEEGCTLQQAHAYAEEMFGKGPSNE